MVSTLGNFFSGLNFFEIHQTFLNNSYYDTLFPFLLIFSLMYTALSYVKIFKNKNTLQPNKPVIFIVSLVVSFFSVSFETSPGYTIGNLLMMLLPNISSLTIGFLALYIVGAIFGKDFLRGFMDKNSSAYVYYALGAIGLGSVVYYVGIALGMWNYNPFDTNSYWNVIFAVALLILGIVFIIIGFIGFGIVFLFVFGTFVFNYGSGNILEYFIDPVVFIFIIVITMLSWMGTYKDEKDELRESLLNADKNFIKFKKLYGGKLPKTYESRVFDNIDHNYQKNKKKWNKRYSNEKW